MKKFLFVIIVACSVMVSCGIKDDPEYKVQNAFNNNINII